MDPLIIGAGISAVSSLLGGRKAAKEQRRAIAEQNAYNHPAAIRARAEEAGFNPLLFIGPGVGQQMTVAQPVMGQAIANAGLAMAQGISQHAETKAYAEKLEQQNAELRKALDSATLRPDVPGIFRASPAQTLAGDTMAALAATGGSVPAVPIAAPVVGRNGEIVATREGIDIEDALTAVPLDAVANLQQEGTLDRDYVDRLFRNAEDLTTFTLRPLFKGAKALATYGADRYLSGPQRSLEAYARKRYGEGEWIMNDDGTASRVP